MLDWELSHAGDAAEDLAHLRSDLEHAISRDEFLAEYNAHAHHTVSSRDVDYFMVYVSFWQAVLSSVTFAGPLLGRCDNFIFASAAYSEYRFHCSQLAQRISALTGV